MPTQVQQKSLDAITQFRDRDSILAELTKHDVMFTQFGNELADVKNTLSSIGGKLDQVASALVITQSKPQWDFNQALQNVVYMSGLVGAAVAAIVYISSNLFAVEMNAAKTEVASVKERSTLYHTDALSQLAQVNEDSKERLGSAVAEFRDRQAQIRERIMNLEKYLIEKSKGANGFEPQLYIPPDPIPQAPPNVTAPRYKDERKL